MTRAALQERITAVAVRPEPHSEGWWRLGVVFDDVDRVEFNVWYRPRSLALSVRRQAEVKDPETPKMVPPDEAKTFRGYRPRTRGK